LNISYNHFIRTSSPQHYRAVEHLWGVLEKKGVLYKSSYEGWYCTSDEEFLSEEEVKDIEVTPATPTSPAVTKKVSALSNRDVEWVKEENYKFRLSQFTTPLLQWLEQNPDFVYPAARYNEVIRLLKDCPPDLDLSVSRSAQRVKWGIPCPSDNSQNIYVWLDALTNYLTVTGYPWDGTNEKGEGSSVYENAWPADFHIIGKDIVRFHTVYWPCFLLAAGLPLPKRVLAHGLFTTNRQKMSKSLGNVIDPKELLEKYGVDATRYIILWSGGMQDDGDYSPEEARLRLNADLSNQLGNLLTRSCAPKINPKNSYPVLPREVQWNEQETELISMMKSLAERVDEQFQNLEFRRGMDEIMALIHATNRYFDHSEPWKLVPKASQSPSTQAENQVRLQQVLYLTLESLRIGGTLLLPIMPQAMNKLLDKLAVPSEHRAMTSATFGAFPSQGDGSLAAETPVLFPRNYV
jgi:methionyl-tRNA synthetase